MGKIHDFGRLGKWSEETLRIQHIVNYFISVDWEIPAIETMYTQIRDSCIHDREYYLNKQIWFPRLRAIQISLKKLEYINKQIKKLDDDYEKYTDVIRKLQIKTKKKQIKYVRKVQAKSIRKKKQIKKQYY